MSCKDHGTLGHFRTLLSRVTVTGEPKKDVDACVDLLVTVFTGYIVAAACIHLGLIIPQTTFLLEQFQLTCTRHHLILRKNTYLI